MVKPETWGETLDMEISRSGSSFHHHHTGSSGSIGGVRTMEGVHTQQQDEELQQQINYNNEVNNKELLQLEDADAKLFGGAQYKRSLREFFRAVKYMPAPVVSEDEIANAAGK